MTGVLAQAHLLGQTATSTLGNTRTASSTAKVRREWGEGSQGWEVRKDGVARLLMLPPWGDGGRVDPLMGPVSTGGARGRWQCP